MTPPDKELTKIVLSAALALFTELDVIAGVPCVDTVEIHVTVHGEELVLGYGEAGEPAILIWQKPTPAIQYPPYVRGFGTETST